MRTALLWSIVKLLSRLIRVEKSWNCWVENIWESLDRLLLFHLGSLLVTAPSQYFHIQENVLIIENEKKYE